MATRLGVEVEFAEKRSSLSLLENVDPLGTIALPAILVGLWIVDSAMAPLIFAFAKPVTIDQSISARRPAVALAIHGAGLLANVAMVFLSALLLYVAYLLPAGFAPFVVQTCRLFVLMNLMLLIIHLVPLPPFDLGRILFDREQRWSPNGIRRGLLAAGGLIAAGAAVTLWFPGVLNPFTYFLWSPSEFLYNQTIVILHAL